MPHQSLNYDANTYLAVTLSSHSNPLALRTVHPAITYVGQVGQLTDIHRVSIPKLEWDQEKEVIMDMLRAAGVVRIDVDNLQQRAKRNENHDEL